MKYNHINRNTVKLPGYFRLNLPLQNLSRCLFVLTGTVLFLSSSAYATKELHPASQQGKISYLRYGNSISPLTVIIGNNNHILNNKYSILITEVI